MAGDAVSRSAAVPQTGDGARCPRCGALDRVRLDKLDARAHTCFRCRECGHIFSPAE